jgi:hypothetical protein
MGIDIGLPIGILLSLLGLILAGYAGLTDTSRYDQPLGINIHFTWEIVLPAFGLTMLLLRRRGVFVAPQKSHPSESSGH